ncbi:tetratricopeptide repeat protein [Flectobacillus sp. BAB-3569]|uniref:tetratricopeptide repeat protein n=1 Tax=Flectobacillus sp. BAB-3569 TaxID=1509483 RepID=UPI000BA41D48|nr:tetratricopeptide repeat protein [Flectobacillus sp. BAB-3569]PAC31487.1 hypothetical protein BWI92_09135 [Flectobacillus sp. BAB-3569]
MSKNRKPAKPVIQPKPSEAKPDTNITSHTSKTWQLYVGITLLLVVVFIAFAGGFNHQFVDWDDHVYIENNYLVTQPSGHWLETWQSHVALNYHPLTIWSLMLNASIWGSTSAKSFIVTNYLLHSINVLLVGYLAFLLSKKNKIVALWVALIYGVHPMRVESVTWISERKDVLYGLFFWATCIVYVQYLQTNKNAKLVWTWVLFVLSCLSKAQAVVLPMVLLLLDYWYDRKFDPKVLLEKIPFFMASLLFGLIATNIQAGGDFHGMIHAIGEQKSALDLKVFTIGERLQFAGYGFMMYCYHLFLPLQLSPFYPYESTGAHVQFYTVGLVFTIIVLLLAGGFYKKSKAFFFGIAFFTITVALVLQFISVGAAIMADRYTYIPYFGLLFAVALGLVYIQQKSPQIGQIVWTIAFLFGGFCFVQTKAQVGVWENTGTLFSTIIQRYPDDYRAYYTLGKYQGEKEGKLEESIANNLKAIELGYKGDTGPWENLGTAYGIKGDTPRALQYFDEAIKRGTKSGETYMNRGIAYFTLQQPQKAIPDFEKSLTMPNRKKAQALTMLGASYISIGNPKKALEVLNELIKSEPQVDYSAYLNRGIAHQQLGHNTEAEADYRIVLAQQPNNAVALQNLKIMGK